MTADQLNRPSANPGGMECQTCGRIFIGDESHSECGLCQNTRPTAVASHAEGEAKPLAEMVYFKRKGSVFEDCLPVMPGEHGNHVRGDLITRVVPLYANPPRSGDEAERTVKENLTVGDEARDAARWRAARDNQGDGLRLIMWDHKAIEELQVMFPSKSLCDDYADAAMAARGEEKETGR